MTSVAAEPLRALLDDVANPVQGLHVVLERRPPEQTDLSQIWRPQARLAALAFDRLDHRGLFAADVGARAAAQVDRRHGARRVRCQLRDFSFQDSPAAVILVAKVDVNLGDADGPGCDERAFEKAVRVALDVVAILERPGLALIDIDGHEPRRRLGRDDLPLAARGKTRAAETSKA